MTYQQIISTPCAAMAHLSYESFFRLLNASYREFIILTAEQKSEMNKTYFDHRSEKIGALERHIEALEKHEHYKRFFEESNTQLAA